MHAATLCQLLAAAAGASSSCSVFVGRADRLAETLAMHRAAVIAGHVVPASADAADDGDTAAAALALEQRLQQLQEEKDAVQLELGKLSGLGVPMSFFKEASLDEAGDFFRRNGYWVFEDAVSGEWLARLQEKWLEAAAPARELWEAAHAVSDDTMKPAPPIDVPDLRGKLQHAAGCELIATAVGCARLWNDASPPAPYYLRVLQALP